MKTTAPIWLVLLAVAGCVTAPVASRDTVSAQLAERAGLHLGPAPKAGKVYLPNGASVSSGILEDEAVLIALWNNAAFQELLADLNIAHGDLVQAGLLPNPEALYFVSMPDKPFKYAVELPLEAFWLRPIREAAATREAQRVGQRVTQAALDLIRDVRQTHADILLARARAEVATEAVAVRTGIAKFAAVRLTEGDISEQEAATARIDAHQADQALARLRYESALAEERFRNLLGLGCDRAAIYLWNCPAPLHLDLDADALSAEATCSRPDALAAEEAYRAAQERLHLARAGWVRFLGIADATSGRATGHELGPAFRFTVPIFNWNQGGIARAEAELERADRNRTTVRNQILLDVRLAHTRYAQARAERDVLVRQVRPEVDRAVRLTQTAYEEGNTPYVVVLETTRQYLDTKVRLAELDADLRRAWADLERSVGRRLCAPAAPPAKMPEVRPLPENREK